MIAAVAAGPKCGGAISRIAHSGRIAWERTHFQIDGAMPVTCEKPMTGSRIFANHAAEYAKHGLRVFPTGGANGKTPLVRGWRKFSSNSWQRFVNDPKFLDANIGLLDGYKIVRIDCDDPVYDDLVENRFGATPIITRTPSGGTHRWYKSRGERRILRLDGAPIDILGFGGFGVAPPSVSPEGGGWSFLQGSLQDIPRLPYIKDRSFAKIYYKPQEISDLGERNITLFRAAQRQSRHLECVDELQFWAEVFNESFDEPLPPAEVSKIVRSVWRRRQEGRLSLNREMAQLSVSNIEDLLDVPRAGCLFVWLAAHHGKRRDQFAVSPKAVARELKWKPGTVRSAVRELCDRKYLRQIHKGGSRKGDCNLYTWGHKWDPNVNTFF